MSLSNKYTVSMSLLWVCAAIASLALSGMAIGQCFVPATINGCTGVMINGGRMCGTYHCPDLINATNPIDVCSGATVGDEECWRTGAAMTDACDYTIRACNGTGPAACYVVVDLLISVQTNLAFNKPCGAPENCLEIDCWDPEPLVP